MGTGELDDFLKLNVEAVPVTQVQKDELDLRLDDLERDPVAGRSWEEFRSELEHKG
jgi:putative addiction module component (TIGR02574 family)